jgi:hypothetical protein
MSDSCETNGNRGSLHRFSALSAQTVKISSMIAHLPRSGLAPSLVQRTVTFSIGEGKIEATSRSGC